MDNKLKLVSFNCKHYKDKGVKFDFMNDLMSNNDIMFIQEHWLYQSHLDKLKLLGGGVSSTGTSSMDETVQRRGRPYGGCAIAWKPNIAGALKITSLPSAHHRLCAIQVNFENDCSFIMFNAYMPVDTYREDDSYYQFIDVINEVQQMIHKYNPSQVLLGGDLNSDLIRDSPQVNYLKNHFISAFNMTACIDLEFANVPYTFICPVTSKTSRIDHFLVTNGISNNVLSCDIMNNHLFSDHVPLCLVLDINVEYFRLQERVHHSKPAWFRASHDQINAYKDMCENNLRNIVYDDDALSCTNVFCIKHSSQICELYNNVIQASVEAASVIPSTAPSGGRSIPGWNQHVEAQKKESLYWHRYWCDQGRPHEGPVAGQMRMSRARYHRAIRHIKKCESDIRMDKMAEAISNNNHRDLYVEVNKIKGRNNKTVPCVDGCCDDETIANNFSDKYNNLYNSVPYDKNEMDDIKKCISSLIANETCKYSVTVDDVIKSVSHLKRGKASGEEDIYSDHVINAPHLLYVFLTLLFNAMLIHGMSPDSMILGTMVPIPKCKFKELDNSDNYRSIALSSVVGKTLDWVILIKENCTLNSSDLQFGFKDKSSTTQCTYVLMETVSYYNYHGSNVYSLLLDATKAFDRVHYCKLFKQLLKRNMSPTVTRLLLYMYTNQKLRVKWGSFTSNVFSVSNGVKQGGVLSPILFSVYMDGLLLKLKQSGIGCHVGNWYVGCLAFADDITLLAPTLSALKKLVSICEDYASEYCVQFNGLKSQFLVFKGRGCSINNNCSIDVNGRSLNNITSTVHLGHNISTTHKESMVSDAICKFWKSFNIFMADFGHIHSFIKCKLFKQYCCSFYGAPLWLLSGKCVSDLCVAWRKALRVIWKIPYMSHKIVVAQLSECMPLEMSLHKRFIKFFVSCLTSKNVVVKGIANMSMYNPFSVSCNNYADIINKYHMYDALNPNVVYTKWKSTLSEDDSVNMSVLREMIDIRDGFKCCDIITMDHIEFIVNDICLN